MQAPIRATLTVALAALSGTAIAASPTRADGAKAPSRIVTASVSGGVLSGMEASDDASGRVFAPKYRLTGPKAIVREIKRDHAGHEDEFTGSITGDNSSLGVGPTVDLGKLSVRVGGAGPYDQPNAARVPETPVFEVTSFRHTDAKCR